MAEERRELRTWRQRIAAPLAPPKGGGEEIQTEALSAKPAKPQIPHSLRVNLFIEESANRPQNGPRLISLGGNRWAEAEWAHGLCAYCPNPLAAGDIVACTDHQGRLPGLAGQPCLILGCPDLTVDIAYCGRHRRMADLGTLWPQEAAPSTPPASLGGPEDGREGG